jgi:hypothetical protein
MSRNDEPTWESVEPSAEDVRRSRQTMARIERIARKPRGSGGKRPFSAIGTWHNPWGMAGKMSAPARGTVVAGTGKPAGE